METKNLLNKKITQWLLLVAMLVGCSTNALAAWLGNSGVAINDTWYKSSSNVDTSHWLNAKTKLSGANLGTFSSSFTIGAQFDTYDNGNTDYCSWNNKTGVYYKITTTSGTQIVAETRLYTCHAEKSGNNNVWKTNGGNSCGDSGSYGTKTIDVSSYTEGDYYLYVYYFSPSSVKYPSSGFTTTERATFKVKKPTKYTYTVYFKRPSNWSNTPHIHTWCDDGDIKSNTEMKSLPNQTGWYYYDVEYSTLQTQFKIMFNNGGWSGGQSGEATASFGSDKYCYSGTTPSTETCPSLCTPPTKDDFTVTNNSKEYNGEGQTATVTGQDGMGDLTVKYGGSASQTSVGEYAITVEVAAGDTYCATTSAITLDDKFEITKASRTISITNSTVKYCQTATPTVTSSVTAGSTDGTISYSIESGGTGTATINSSTGVITCTAPGTVIVKASISEGTNYKAAVSTTKTFTFDASTVAGQVYVTGTTSNTVSICSGGSTSLTSYNKTGSVVKWMYQEGAEVGTDTWHDIASTADTYTPQNLTQQTKYKVSVKNGTCGSGGSSATTVNIASSEITQVLPAPTFEAVAIGSTGTARNFQFTACGISINPSDLNITLYSDATHGGADGRTQFKLGTPSLSNGVLTVPVFFKPTKNNTSGTNEWGAQIRLESKTTSEYVKKSAVFTAAVTCTTVAAAQYELKNNSYTYDGTNKTVTVTPNTGAGAVSKIMYAGAEGGKTNAGTYAITINSALGDTYCAASGLNVGNLTIGKKTPVVGDFTIKIPEEREYDGTAKAATVVPNGVTGMGAVTVKYNDNTTVPTAAGTYTVTFDVAAGDNYSAKAGLSAGTMNITKASRTITLDNTDLTNCQTSPFTLTSTVNKGPGDGAVTYEIVTGGTGDGSITGSTLSCTTPGTIIVKAKVAEGTNYQADESTTKTFTFQPSSVGGTLAPATADVCYGGSQELTLSGQTGTIQKWQYSYDGTSWNDITSTDNPYNVENIQNNLQLRVVVKSGECAAANSAVSAITVKGAPISIAGSGAKSTSATYPWEYFNFTATTTATDTQITWNCVYSTSLEASKTVFEWSGKTAKLKSGAPASESAHYTVTAKTNVGGCELTSSGYDVYINAAPAEDCGK
ncbi:MAG: MBG domain-containing protein [Paludibacteraceae bacterium]|nr:MBG domain-containing protein [Paludibacteraceae bacterium]